MRKVVTYTLITAAVLLLVIIFVAFRDDINQDTLGFLSGIFTRDNGSPGTGRITFDEDRGTVLTLCEDSLTALSPDRLVLYDKGGSERLSRSVSFNNPALAIAGSKVIAYDREGSVAVVADSGGVRAEFNFPVLTAAGNSRGQYVLVTGESGYRGVARLYDQKNRPVYEWYSADRYIWAVSLSPSGSRMAVAAMGQQEDSVGLRVVFLDTGRAEPLGTADIADELVLSVFSPDNNHVCIITESGVYFYTDDGLPLGQFAFYGQTLLSSPITTADGVFLNLGRGAGSQYSQLICLSYDGTELGRTALTEGAAALAAAGRSCTVLEAGILTRYTLDGESLKPDILGPSSARGLLAAANGDILLLFSGYAEWYNDRQGVV